MPPYTAQPVEVEAPELAARLTRAAAAAGLSMRELATASGLDKNTVSAWQRGTTTRVRVSNVRRLATVLDTTAEHLLDMPPAQSRPNPPPTNASLLRRIAALAPVSETLAEVAEEARRASGT